MGFVGFARFTKFTGFGCPSEGETLFSFTVEDLFAHAAASRPEVLRMGLGFRGFHV